MSDPLLRQWEMLKLIPRERKIQWTQKSGQWFKLYSVEIEKYKMSESKRKVFTGAQKAKIALEAVRGIKTINEIGQDNNVHPTQVSQWKKELMDNAGSLFDVKRGPKLTNTQNDPDRLYAKIGQLNMELDWLKKKSGLSLQQNDSRGQRKMRRWRYPCNASC